jgi:hypothetical protein
VPGLSCRIKHPIHPAQRFLSPAKRWGIITAAEPYGADHRIRTVAAPGCSAMWALSQGRGRSVGFEPTRTDLSPP